jgi:hypothetical protein
VMCRDRLHVHTRDLIKWYLTIGFLHDITREILTLVSLKFVDNTQNAFGK